MPNSTQLSRIYGNCSMERWFSVAYLSKKNLKKLLTTNVRTFLFPIRIHRQITMLNNVCFIFYSRLRLSKKRNFVVECRINCSQSIWRVHNYWNFFNNNDNVEMDNWVDKRGTCPCNKHSHRLFHRYLRSHRTLPCWKHTNEYFFIFRWKWNPFLLIKYSY